MSELRDAVSAMALHGVKEELFDTEPEETLVSVVYDALTHNEYQAEAALASLDEGHLRRGLHKNIWQAMKLLLKEGGSGCSVGWDELQIALQKLGHVRTVEERYPYLTFLGEKPTIGSIPFLVQEVNERWLRRQLFEHGWKLEHLAKNMMLQPDDVLSEAVAFLSNLQSTGKGCEVVNAADYAMERLGIGHFSAGDPTARSCKTGLVGLDERIKMHPGNLSVVAARTSVGKTIMGAQIAIEAAKLGSKVTFVNLDMNLVGFTARLVSHETHINFRALEEGKFTAADIASNIGNLRNIDIIDKPSFTPWPVLEAILKEQIRKGSNVLVIDYFGLIAPPKTHAKANAAEGMKLVSLGLRQLAKQYGVQVVLLQQINREPGDTGEPELVHLRDSGQLEQDAQVVILMWNKDTKKTGPAIPMANVPKSADKTEDVIWVKIAKNQTGPSGYRCQLERHGEIATFLHKET